MLERTHTGEQLVQHHAQRPHVASRAERISFDLLGAGVGRGHRLRGGDQLGVAVQQARDAEIQQLGLPRGIDEQIGRLDVAMDHQTLVRIGHRGTDLQEQPDATAHIQRMRLAPAVDALAIDIFHRQERLALGIAAGVDQIRDVGVIQAGENALLFLEPRLLGERPEAQALQRHAQAHSAGIALGQPNHAHAALADALDQAISRLRGGVDVKPLRQFGGRPCDQLGNIIVCRIFGGLDQPLHLAPQGRVGTAMRSQAGLSFVQRSFEHLVHDGLGSGVAVLTHPPARAAAMRAPCASRARWWRGPRQAHRRFRRVPARQRT